MRRLTSAADAVIYARMTSAGKARMRRLLKPLWFLFAVLFLVEAWLWDRLAPLVAWCVEALPWRRWKDELATAIARLSPAATLVVFAVPAGLLVPVKLGAVWLFAHDHWFVGAATLLAAKVLGLGISAFLFDLCRDKLLTMPWFAWLYRTVLAVRDWAHRQTEPFRRRLRAAVERVRRRFGPNGAFQRRFAALRRRVHRVHRA